MSEICSFRIEGEEVKVSRVFNNRLKFKCIRCARLCCKLGGTQLTKREIAKLEKIGFGTGQILHSSKILRTKSNGECIFLSFDEKNARYKCDIHEFRPILCRTFPFHAQPKGSNGEYILSVLPCCGLSRSKGRRINKDFIQNELSPILLAVLKGQSEARVFNGYKEA